MNHRRRIAARLSLATVVLAAAALMLVTPSVHAGRAAHLASGPVARSVRWTNVAGGASAAALLVAAAPLTTTTSTALPTRTQPPTPPAMPTIDPTPQGSPIAVGAPLPTPALAADAITAGNAFEVREVARFTPPTEGKEVLVAISPDGRVLYSVSGRNELVARSLADGVILWRRYMQYDSYWPAMAVSPDGRVLASSDYESLVLLDTTNGEPLQRHAPRRSFQALTFADDGRRLAALGHDAYVAEWDVATGELLADRQVARDTEVSPRLRPGAAEVSAVTWWSNTLSLWDILSGAALWSAAPPPALGPAPLTGTRSAWSRNGRFVAWTVYGNGRTDTANAWICRSDLKTSPTCAPMAVYGGSFGDVGWVLVVSNDGLVVVGGERHSHPGVCQRLGVEVSNGQGTARTVFDAPGRNMDNVEINPDGTLLAVSHRACGDGMDVKTTLIAIDTGLVVATMSDVTMPRFTPDGGRLIANDGWDWDAGGGLRLYGVVPGSGRGRRVFLPVGWAGQ